MDLNIEDIIKSYMLLSFQSARSNNIVGVIWTFVLMFMVGYFKPIKEIVSSWFNGWGSAKKTATIQMVGSIIEDRFGTRRQFSKRFISLLHYVSSDISHIGVNEMIEICTEDHTICRNKIDDMLVNQTYPVKISKDIHCKFNIETDDSINEKTKAKYTKVNVDVYSNTLDISQLLKFIDKCVESYTAHLNKLIQDNIYYFVYDKEGENEGFKKILFQSNKTFDNVFFQSKAELISRLDLFQTGADTYKKFGIPHTFGILMHGEPGTGKTSTIKAIANYTKRHIISIPLYKITDITVLSKLFHNEEIDGITVPFNKRIYVFEEIDCNGLKEIVKTRSKIHSGDIERQHVEKAVSSLLKDLKEEAHTKDIYSLLESNMISSATCKPQQSTNLTLGGLLELIDGIVETPGRIIILTTNHPELLDSALIRPGRIDMNICYKNTSLDDVKEMFKLWYDYILTPEEEAEVCPETFSHADVCQMFFRELYNPQKVLQNLRRSSQCDNKMSL